MESWAVVIRPFLFSIGMSKFLKPIFPKPHLFRIDINNCIYLVHSKRFVYLYRRHAHQRRIM